LNGLKVPIHCYLVILLVCITIEYIVYLALARPKIIQFRPLRLLLVAIIVNTLTNPLINFLYREFGVNIIFLELGVFVVEAILIKLLMPLRVSFTRAIIVSFCANLISFLSSFIPIIQKLFEFFGCVSNVSMCLGLPALV
jgi:hypothetical protein